ncbi:hypothetical protein EPYR_01853 [Erwinia pyrifoliae DSM 12163]|nr:hypothetical protein [Erwinia sp. Ejp617]ADP12649.1 hypothetical protein EJP617_29680 [Erwinia sp. Ejp617]CAY74233.1 hypothetical protein EPYR_01853 [Erwinia pyrifoliae DSM 12163]
MPQTEPKDKPHPARDKPKEQGEIPRAPDSSEDDKKNPYRRR